MVKSGDLTGSTSPVKSGTTHINITINQVTP
jgi:hypothetical protein